MPLTLVPPPDPQRGLLPWEEDESPAVPVPGRHADPRSGRLAEALLPERWRGRFEIGPWHVVVVVVAACAALAAATWLTIRHQPRVLPPVAAVGTAEPLLSMPSAAASVTVDVEGRVRRPGIVVLRKGARVVDAVRAAGGTAVRADLGGLNLAAPLSDGQQVQVGAASQAGAGGAASGGNALVSLNSATAEDLDAVPGVGPVTAQSIVTWRAQHGAFSSVDELLEVDGIGPGKLAKIKPHVTV